MNMLEFMTRLLKPPLFADREEQYVASISNTIALTLLLFSVIYFFKEFRNENSWQHILTVASGDIIIIYILYFLHKGYTKPIRITIPLALLAFLTFLLYGGSGFRDISIIGFPIVIVLAGLLLGRKAPPIFALLCMLALLFIYYGEKVGLVRSPSEFQTTLADLTNIYLYLAIMAALLRLLIGNLSDSLSQTRRQEKALVQTNRELEKYQSQLEELVDERTRKLSQTLSDLQSTQEELVAAKEIAEKANQAKSDFLSSMSHELRTPLNGILGYAQILKQSASLTASEKNGLKIIHQSGNHLLTLINDILDLSKIEARKMELNPQDLHLSSFLNSVVAIIRMRAQQKDVLFVYQSDEKLPTGIKADEKRLRQVLLNLLGNAVKFTQRGEVALKVSLLERNQALSRLRFEIIDTGVGMSPQQLEKIFLPFEQVGDNKQRAQGTGLGLAITRQLVKLMGGDVYVESELGKGSQFWFDLSFPVVEQAQTKEEIETLRRITGYKGKALKVLVVDDKAENRYVLRDLLTPLGFEIEEGEDGQQAVELARSLSPDLILTDLVMPVMDGFQAVKAIRQFDKEVPIIVISANVWEAEQQLSLKIGCHAFLPKPVDIQKLLALIERHAYVEWRYEEKATDSKPSCEQPLIPPPPQQLEALYEAAMMGMMRSIRKLADEIEQLDAKYAPFALKVRELAQGFEDEKIVALVEQHLR